MTLPYIHLTRGQAGCTLAVRRNAVAIVVDALRASTTIAVLLAHGAARVLVVARVEDARALAATLPDALLVGERGGERLPGFHLGNSPLEVLASPRMDGATVVFTSSNGAQRLTASCLADKVLVGSVANASAVAAFTRPYADAAGRDVVTVAAGKYPDEAYVSPEDEATGAYLAFRIGLPLADDSRADGAAWEARLVLEGLETIFRASRHAQRLMEIGYGEDVLFCARPDTVDVVPIVTGALTQHGRDIGVEVVGLAR
jgi:2-phosphosulfolactate phosphatase